jgi:two-component system response regulator AtoC
MAPSIVLVDDERHILDLQMAALEGIGFRATAFTDPNSAWEHIQKNKIDLIITDCNMPGMSGLELLFKTRSQSYPPDVIFITGFGTVPLAVQALSGGAFGFLEKPFDIGAYQSVVDKAIRRHQQPVSTLSPPPAVARASKFNRPISVGPKMELALNLAASAAASDSTILLTGESGTGKEVLADFIHSNSPRAKGPLIKVNCGALPEHLIESELFGHEKGAFTGADKRHIGRFEQAHDGTLFLDEIGDLGFSLQVKLLRALQEHCIERLGSTASINVNFRLICATHRDLKGLVAQNQFREDLYYRINVMPIQIPPLRNRREDIARLAQYFFDTLRAKLARGPDIISAEAYAALEAFSWPGNVRQLRNAIEYSLIVCSGNSVLKEHLPEEVRIGVVQNDTPAGKGASTYVAEQAEQKAAPGATARLKDSVQEAEAQAILAALERNKWRISQTAKELNISRSTLYLRMNNYNIKRE